MKRRMLAVAAVTSLAVAGPVAVAQGAASKAKVTQGVVYGAITAQDFPVVIETNKAGTKVTKANIVLNLACQVPPSISGLGDSYKNLPIKAGSFSSSFGPQRIPADPVAQTPALDVSGSIAGKLNKTHTRVAGTWTLKIVAYNPADPTATTILDTCDSGTVRFTAKN